MSFHTAGALRPQRGIADGNRAAFSQPASVAAPADANASREAAVLIRQQLADLETRLASAITRLRAASHENAIKHEIEDLRLELRNQRAALATLSERAAAPVRALDPRPFAGAAALVLGGRTAFGIVARG